MHEDELRAQADALLAQAGCGDLTERAFDTQWSRIVTQPEIEVLVEAETVAADDGGPEITMRRLMTGCTRHQREVWRLARLLHPQARARQVALSTMMAERLGVSQRAVRYMLSRLYCRMESRYRMLTSREPSRDVCAVWRAEQHHKRRQVYRRPSSHWVSAYLHERRKRRER